jgi:hypothetical protein
MILLEDGTSGGFFYYGGESWGFLKCGDFFNKPKNCKFLDHSAACGYFTGWLHRDISRHVQMCLRDQSNALGSE